jgi:hypothetical protein
MADPLRLPTLRRLICHDPKLSSTPFLTSRFPISPFPGLRISSDSHVPCGYTGRHRTRSRGLKAEREATCNFLVFSYMLVCASQHRTKRSVRLEQAR